MTDNEKHTIRKLLFKTLMALLLLAALDVLYYFTLYPKDLEKHCSLMEVSQRAKDGVDIVYLGESSNRSSSKSDTDKRYISTMIGDLLPDHHVGNLSKDACHAGIYYDILRNIPRRSNVKTAIVTVNMRSFATEWLYSELEPALRKEQVMMRKGPALYRRMLLAFLPSTSWTEEERSDLMRMGFEQETLTFPYPFPYRNAIEWDTAVGRYCVLFDGSRPSLDTIALACHHIKHFAFNLNDNNPRIKDLDNIVTLCQKRGWQPVFNILAENVDQIDSLCGPDLLFLLNQNVQYVIDRYEAMGVITVNNLTAVRDTSFIDRDFPTEHSDQTGRMTIAENVAATLKRRLR